MKSKFYFVIFFLFISTFNIKSQTLTTFDKGLAIGNILIQGYMAIKGNGKKPIDPDAKTVESFCFKNKMDEKITIKLMAKLMKKR